MGPKWPAGVAAGLWRPHSPGSTRKVVPHRMLRRSWENYTDFRQLSIDIVIIIVMIKKWGLRCASLKVSLMKRRETPMHADANLHPSPARTANYAGHPASGRSGGPCRN